MSLKHKTLAAEQFIRRKQMTLVLMGHNNINQCKAIYFAIKVFEDTRKLYFLSSLQDATESNKACPSKPGLCITCTVHI